MNKISKAETLAFAMALIGAGLLPAIYDVAVNTWGESRTKELVEWAIQSQQKYEASTNAPPVVVIPDQPQPGQPSNVDAIDITNVTLFGPHKNKNPAKARITDTLSSVRVRGDGIVMDYRTSGWPNNDSGIGANIDGRVYILWMKGDSVVGGHFDWKRPNAKDRSFENIRKGYLDGNQPPNGATIWFVLMTNKGDRRTNVVKADGVWP